MPEGKELISPKLPPELEKQVGVLARNYVDRPLSNAASAVLQDLVSFDSEAVLAYVKSLSSQDPFALFISIVVRALDSSSD